MSASCELSVLNSNLQIRRGPRHWHPPAERLSITWRKHAISQISASHARRTQWSTPHTQCACASSSVPRWVERSGKTSSGSREKSFLKTMLIVLQETRRWPSNTFSFYYAANSVQDSGRICAPHASSGESYPTLICLCSVHVLQVISGRNPDRLDRFVLLQQYGAMWSSSLNLSFSSHSSRGICLSEADCYLSNLAPVRRSLVWPTCMFFLHNTVATALQRG